MSETNMRAVQKAVGTHVVALARVVSDLEEIEQQFKAEILFPHFEDEISDVRHTLRLVQRRLAELHREYALHADTRDPLGPSVLGPETKVIDQPISPATPA